MITQLYNTRGKNEKTLICFSYLMCKYIYYWIRKYSKFHPEKKKPTVNLKELASENSNQDSKYLLFA